MPVFASAEAQVSLARGAALALARNADVTDEPIHDKPAGRRSWLESHSQALGMAASVVIFLIALLAVVPQIVAEKESSPAEDPQDPVAAVLSPVVGALP